ncbi:MAG: hypothetical protein WA254_04130 [Candidatus Sulfotelmatobacter sp.]
MIEVALARRKIIVAVIVLGLAVSALAWLRVYYVIDKSGGDLVWNSSDAYVFIGVVESGHTFSYLGFLGELVRELFPFGASEPEKKHYYAVVLHITQEAVQRYTFDNFWYGGVFPVGKTISAGNYLDATRTKWSGTHFEPMTPAEEKEWREGAQMIPPGPAYDNIAGWSNRKAGGEVVRESSTHFIETNAEATIELGGKPLTLRMNSGFISHEAFIDLLRQGHAPERVWHLNENPERVNKATYEQIFGNGPVGK